MYETPWHSGSISNAQFLVTGGAGFIGSHIVEYLVAQGAGRIVVLDDLATGFHDNIAKFVESGKVTHILGSICDPDTCQEACKGIDYIFHLAALGSVPRSIKNPIRTHEVNASGFLNILVAAKDNGVKRVVYSSSSSVYGDNTDMPKLEEKTGKPLSPYAVTKAMNEVYAGVFHRVYGLGVVGLRYFNVFGPRQNPKGEYAAVIPLFMDALLHGRSPIIFGDGEQCRDFTFVANVVQANMKAMFASHAEAEGGVYNIALSQTISVNQLFASLRELTEANVDAEYREARKGDIRDSLADVSKAHGILGYKGEIGVEDGLKVTLDWFKAAFGS